jgi:hypothetical protein
MLLNHFQSAAMSSTAPLNTPLDTVANQYTDCGDNCAEKKRLELERRQAERTEQNKSIAVKALTMKIKEGIKVRSFLLAADFVIYALYILYIYNGTDGFKDPKLEAVN